MLLMQRPPNIQTERLVLVALLPEEIAALIDGDLGRFASLTGFRFPPAHANIGDLPWHLRAIEADAQQLPWRIRVVAERSSKTVVGSIILKGPPGSAGDVEIGWGLMENVRGRGYATEAAAAVITWVAEQPGVCSISATIPDGDYPSQRLAKRLGMIPTSHTRRDLPLWECDQVRPKSGTDRATSGAPAPDGDIALGLGLTNECNLACAFCYRDPVRTDRLSLDQVKSVMERLPVRSVNLGTGENGMHPDFKAILEYLRTRQVKLTITSNGHSVAVLEDNELRAFHDIEFSLDYPTQAEQDQLRGLGNWSLIHKQAERCVRLGVPVTIIAVMMQSNYLRLVGVARVAKRFNAPLRVNVYQSVRSDVYALTYEQYWDGFQQLFEKTDVIAIGEPLVRAMAGLPPLTGGCGVSTVRVTPRATTQPCIYWPGSGEPLSDLLSTGTGILNSAPFELARALPDACKPCEFRDSCHGGCAGRRRLQGALAQPDNYCPIVRGEQRNLRIRLAVARDLPKLSSSCTTVVIAREADM